MMNLAYDVNISGLLRGEPIAYKGLFELYGDRSLRIALKYAGNLDDAQDIVQQTMVKVWQKIESFEDGSPFSNWYFTILVNTCRDWRRVAFYRLRKSFANVEMRDEGIMQAEATQVDWINRMVLKMPRKMRMIFILHYQEEFSMKDIAEIFRISIDTVRVQLMKGRRYLREIYENKAEEK
jgi:RNA polymerase sigma-70 factor (ECF subfamily)